MGLSKNAVTLLRVSGWKQNNIELLADSTRDFEGLPTTDQLMEKFESLILESGFNGFPLEVVMTDEWVRYFMVTPAKNSGSMDDLHASAMMRFKNLYGDRLNDWHIEADWDSTCTFLACALPIKLLIRLQQIAEKSKLTLTLLTPNFISLWNFWNKKIKVGSWFGVVNNGYLTLGVIQKNLLCGIRTVLLPAYADKEWLLNYIKREALILNVDETDTLMLCGSVPSMWINNTLALECISLDSSFQEKLPLNMTDSKVLAYSGLIQ